MRTRLRQNFGRILRDRPPAAAPQARRLVGEVGLEPTKASASGFTVRPLCRSGHSPEPRIPADAWVEPGYGERVGRCQPRQIRLRQRSNRTWYLDLGAAAR